MTPIGYSVRICVQGELGPGWFAMFAGLRVDSLPDGTTLITGDLPDQSALYGLLAAIRDLGPTLISVETTAVALELAADDKA